MKIYCKDFEIKSVYIGSRLQSGPQWAYRVYYTAPDGRQTSIKGLFYRKSDARKTISERVRLLNSLIKEHESRTKKR